ncbi:MAG TPA: hypothetical protein PK999_12090 [Nitrospira sp.]|jgi:hypothetical protein|nr:hypothetical protein [Nitrospira sp.]
MSTRPKRLIAGSQLTTSAATYYTATGLKARIDNLTLTNTTAGAVTATVHLVPNGGSASASNCILSAKSINAGDSYVVPGAIAQWLEDGGTIQALASANTSIGIVASGVEYT